MKKGGLGQEGSREQEETDTDEVTLTNLEVTLAHFWQFATHWSNGDQAKMRMSCEAGKLHLEFHVDLDHPDNQHFPNNNTKKLSPSKIRRQERRHPENVKKSEKCQK